MQLQPQRHLQTPLPSTPPVLTPSERWLNHVQQHMRSDNALALMYRSLRAPYEFLVPTIARIEARVQALLSAADTPVPYFVFQPRGSVTTQTALRGTGDLDIDIILTRDFSQKLTDEKKLEEMSPKERDEMFQKLLQDL